jgi:hypothetical protein
MIKHLILLTYFFLFSQNSALAKEPPLSEENIRLLVPDYKLQYGLYEIISPITGNVIYLYRETDKVVIEVIPPAFQKSNEKQGDKRGIFNNQLR